MGGHSLPSHLRAVFFMNLDLDALRAFLADFLGARDFLADFLAALDFLDSFLADLAFLTFLAGFFFGEGLTLGADFALGALAFLAAFSESWCSTFSFWYCLYRADFWYFARAFS